MNELTEETLPVGKKGGGNSGKSFGELMRVPTIDLWSSNASSISHLLSLGFGEGESEMREGGRERLVDHLRSVAAVLWRSDYEGHQSDHGIPTWLLPGGQTTVRPG